MAPLCSRFGAPLVLLAAAGMALAQDPEHSESAAIRARAPQHPLGSVALRVSNLAASAVHLRSCEADHKVQAGATATLNLTDLAGFMVVPEELAWDCRAGPHDLFYVVVNLRQNSSYVAGVGYGLDSAPEVSERPAASGQEAALSGDGVAGVRLAAGAHGGVVTCTSDAGCRGSVEVEAPPATLELAVLGPEVAAAAHTTLLRGGRPERRPPPRQGAPARRHCGYICREGGIAVIR